MGVNLRFLVDFSVGGIICCEIPVHIFGGFYRNVLFSRWVETHGTIIGSIQLSVSIVLRLFCYMFNWSPS